MVCSIFQTLTVSYYKNILFYIFFLISLSLLKDNLPSLVGGILNQDQFILTLVNASNGFPAKIQIQTKIFDSSLNMTLYLVEGLISNSSIYSKVTFVNSSSMNSNNGRDLVSFVSLIEFFNLKR